MIFRNFLDYTEMSHVFISYVRENQQQADALSSALKVVGVDVWLDREAIEPGQRWRRAIRDAIRNGAFFIALFSMEYRLRTRSYMNEELTIAIEELRQRAIDRSWFIPIVLDGGAVPNIDVSVTETLQHFQWIELPVDVHSDQWWRAVNRIQTVIQPDNLSSRHDETESLLPNKVKTSVVRRAEVELGSVLRETAKETIDTALEEFKEFDGERSYLLRPLCEVFGNQFTKAQVRLMVTRGLYKISRAGFHGLCSLYSHHPVHMRRLHLEEVFHDMPQLLHFVRLREKFPDDDLLHMVMDRPPEDLEIDDVYVDKDYFFDKFANRGESAFIDAVFSKEEQGGG